MVFKGFHGGLGTQLHRLKMKMLKYIPEFSVYFIVVLEEMFITFFTNTPYYRIAFGRLFGIFFLHGGLCQFNKGRVIGTAGCPVAGDKDQQCLFYGSWSG